MYTFTSAEGYLASANASEASCVVIDIDLRGEMSGLNLGKVISSRIRPRRNRPRTVPPGHFDSVRVTIMP